MPGTPEGAKKARETNIKNDPDFYMKIGSKSWDNPDRSREVGFATLTKEQHLEISKKGGLKTKKDYKQRDDLETPIASESSMPIL